MIEKCIYRIYIYIYIYIARSSIVKYVLDPLFRRVSKIYENNMKIIRRKIGHNERTNEKLLRNSCENNANIIQKQFGNNAKLIRKTCER